MPDSSSAAAGALKVMTGEAEIYPVGPLEGTTVTSSASADTYGSYVTIGTPTGAGKIIAITIVPSGTNTKIYTDVKIGLGASPTVARIIRIGLLDSSAADVGSRGWRVDLLIPITNAAATAVKMAIADSFAGAEDVFASFEYIDDDKVKNW